MRPYWVPGPTVRRGTAGAGAKSVTLNHLMKTLAGIILIIAGIVLFFQGLNRRDSLVGHASSAGTSIANSVDGGARQPKHVWYMVGGGALVLVGIGVAASRGNPNRL